MSYAGDLRWMLEDLVGLPVAGSGAGERCKVTRIESDPRRWRNSTVFYRSERSGESYQEPLSSFPHLCNIVEDQAESQGVSLK